MGAEFWGQTIDGHRDSSMALNEQALSKERVNRGNSSQLVPVPATVSTKGGMSDGGRPNIAAAQQRHSAQVKRQGTRQLASKAA